MAWNNERGTDLYEVQVWVFCHIAVPQNAELGKPSSITSNSLPTLQQPVAPRHAASFEGSEGETVKTLGKPEND
jgi:hypothetical protein